LLFNKNRIYNINTGNNWDLGNSDNQIIANPLTTPNNILPEWYYLWYYSILRSFPDKTIGVIVVLNILIMIIIFLFKTSI